MKIGSTVHMCLPSRCTARKSGLAAIPISVTRLRSLAMTELKMDEDTIITALLHDTVEDTLTTIEQIENKFGPEVAHLSMV